MCMRTALILSAVAAMLWGSTVFAQPIDITPPPFAYQNVVDTPHNLVGANAPLQDVCLGCHLAPPVDANGLVATPAWSARGSNTPYGIGVRNADGSFTEFSDTTQVCLQCHDGVLALSVHRPGEGQPSEFGGSKHPDHPVMIDYPRDPSGNFIKPTPLPQNRQFWSVPDIIDEQLVLPSGPLSSYQPIPDEDPTVLMGTLVRTRAGKIHCESCHNPHDNAFPPFLRQMPPKLCLVCHDK